MTDQTSEVIIARCGLICSQCGAYVKGRCGGCHSEKPMNFGCKVKPCTQEKNYNTCAECEDFENLKECRKLNNFISRFFGFIFRTDRIGNLNCIRNTGLENFKKTLTEIDQ